jgi:pimeloyl-ACP methyl ester carboxylesterase
MNSLVETRGRLLAGIPFAERELHLSGVSTAVLEGGDGAPMVLLHGPGEVAATWLPVLSELASRHRVIVPDLPGHGASRILDGPLDAERILSWLGELVEHTCSAPPVLVGRVVGGAIAARFAIAHPARVSRLVLVDTSGLVAFGPDPRFALALNRYLAEPSSSSYERFMDLCAFDLDAARDRLGDLWEPFAEYAVELARSPSVQGAIGSMIGLFAAQPMSPSELDRIEVPTALIWGRHDLATPLHVAESVSARTGWPLYVIEDAGDDPALDQPTAFLEALSAILGTPVAAAAREA